MSAALVFVIALSQQAVIFRPAAVVEVELEIRIRPVAQVTRDVGHADGLKRSTLGAICDLHDGRDYSFAPPCSNIDRIVSHHLRVRPALRIVGYKLGQLDSDGAGQPVSSIVSSGQTSR